MKQAGAKTIAQDEESCIVFGMPQMAIKMGAVTRSFPFPNWQPESLHIEIKRIERTLWIYYRIFPART